MTSWGESGTLCKGRTCTHLRNQNKEEAPTQSELEDSGSPPKEGNEKSHKCEWNQGERNFLLLFRKEGFMRQVSKTESNDSRAQSSVSAWAPSSEDPQEERRS